MNLGSRYHRSFVFVALALVIIFLRADIIQPVQAEPDVADPVADAGEDMLVNYVTAAKFDGSNSTDDKNISRYVWTFDHDGEPVTLWGVVAYFPFTVHGEYKVTLNVSDVAGNWDTDEITVTVLTPPGPPSSILSIDYDGYVDVAWGEAEHDGGSPVLGYIVYRGTTQDDLQALYSVDTANRFLRDLYVSNGVTYYYAVSAMNDIWLGPLSEITNSTPIGPVMAPLNFTVTVEDGTIHLEWDSPNITSGMAPVLGFTIFRGTDPDLVEPIANVSVIYNYTDEEVEPGKTYYYAVSTTTYLGTGPITDILNTTVEEEWATRDAVITLLILILPWVVIIWFLVRYLKPSKEDEEPVKED
jgi:hypothetical protein